MYWWSTRFIARFAAAGSRFEDLTEGIARHRDGSRAGFALARDPGDAHVDSPSRATVERCLFRINDSEERVSAGLVEQPPLCHEVACWVSNAASLEVEDSNHFPLSCEKVAGVEIAQPPPVEAFILAQVA